jgi:hypothetical protein
MALAATLRSIERAGAASLVNYGQFLEANPPADEAEIAPETSWSCAHGLGRWREDCGCRLVAGTRQGWRGPLRSAFDHLREAIDPKWESAASLYFADAWRARDEADGLFRAVPGGVEGFFARHAARPLRAGERRRAIELLDMQRNLLRTSTSCGWFFDDVAGLEARQVIAYAARAVELAERTLGPGFEEPFRARLSEAIGNDAASPDARAVYDEILDQAPLVPVSAPVTIDPAAGFEEGLRAAADAAERNPADRAALSAWRRLVELSAVLPFPVTLWSAQNVYHRMRKSAVASFRARAIAGDTSAASWLAEFDALRDLLSFAPDR